MQSRRAFTVGGVALLVPWRSQAQAAAFVGNWQGDVPGIGAARLIVTAVRPDGRVEGRMEFDLQSFVSTFSDKADSAKSTNYGVAKGSTLAIDAALGGRYELTLEGNRLSGVYTRGTTYRVPVTFTKS
jgi:hypothetical protein